jgi:hypothetical protein
VTGARGTARLAPRIGGAGRARGATRPGEATWGIWLALIAVGGFALRVVYAFTLAKRLPGVGDDAFYYYSSNLIAQGHGYSAPLTFFFHGQLVPTALHPPLWPGLLAALSLFTAPTHGVGTMTGAALDAHRIFGCACGAVVVVLVGLLGRRVSDWRVGLLAAALAAVYPRFIVLDGYLSSEPLTGILVGVLLLAAFGFTARPTRGRALLMGAVVGLAALTREEALLFVVVLLIPLAWRAGPDRRMLTVMAVLGTVLVVGPWTVRNYFAFHRFVPVSNSGAVIGGANCALTYYGSAIGSWQAGCLHDHHPSPNEAVESDRQQAQGLRYAGDHPARAVLVAGVRLLRVWSLFAPTDQAVGQRTVLWIGTILYYLLLAAAIGALVVRIRRRQAVLILVAPAIVVSIAAIVGDGPERLRYDAEMPMLVLAAWTILVLSGRRAHLRERAAHVARTTLAR